MQKTSHPIEPDEMMAYLDGELSAQRASAAAAHLERCPECQALSADLRMVSQSMLTWQVESGATEITPALAAALAQRRTGKERSRMRPWMWGLVAAVLVIMVTLPPFFNRYKMAHTNATMARFIDPPDQIQPAPALAVEPSMIGSSPKAPMVARTSTLSLTTNEFDRVRGVIDDILKRRNGYLANLNVNAPTGGQRTLEATLRIPAADLSPAMSDLKQLGRVESEKQSGEEVTEQYVNLEARLANAHNTEQRLTGILHDRTGKLSDVLEVERELDRVRGEIERMEAEKKTLTKRVDFATVNLTVSENYKAHLDVVPDSAFGKIRNAAVEGYRNMIDGLLSIALFIATAGPTILLWIAILFFPARFAWRRFR